MQLTRRDLFRAAIGAPLLAALPSRASSSSAGVITIESLIRAPGRVIASDGSADTARIELSRVWQSSICRSRVTNHRTNPVAIKEIVLFDLPSSLTADTRLYGEGFQMLSQSGGTIGTPVDLGNYTDLKHYRMPTPPGARVCYGMMTLAPTGGGHQVLAFTSCRRFVGQFYLRENSLQVVVDTEGLSLGPRETWELEEFSFGDGPERKDLLDRLARRIGSNHPPLLTATPPAGWCSWYCFGPRVTAQEVIDNLDVIARQSPGLKYIQIDDGYQPAMGDWLETGPAFGGEVKNVLKQIQQRGFQPAIWVAPFVAEEKSHLFRDHPEWFMKDAAGHPLPSDRVTFGGWRRGPWYALDGTHPGAQQHLTELFATMRHDWGCTYFKLDANFWGAMHGARLYDGRATRVEAYRRGMHAILRGAKESFILGCNHPIWPSLGLIHGSRSSNDIKRAWDRFESTARQNLSRNWQNGRLWWNDPDVLVLTGDLSEDEFQFHATAIYASGGLILSGDDLTRLSAEKLAMLRRLQPPTGVAATFDDDSLQVGRIRQSDRELICLLNWTDAPAPISAPLRRPVDIKDFWTDEALGHHQGAFTVENLPRHSARLLVCT